METLVSFLIYDSSSGAVMGSGISQVETLASEYIPPGGVLIEGVEVDPLTEYIDVATEEVIPRPVMGTTLDVTAIAADGVDEATVSGIPDGASVVVTCNEAKTRYEAVIHDGTLIITTDDPGAYVVTVTYAMNIPEVHTIVAT